MTTWVARDAAIEVAWRFYRQGLLEEAEQSLASIEANASVRDRGAAQLLLGNVAYERGDYARAAEAWKSAAGLFAYDEATIDSARVAVENLGMAEARLARSLELARKSEQLELELAAVVIFAAIVLALGYWRAKAAPEAPPG